VRTLRGHYAAAYEDVERAVPGGAAALEVGAWASYFDRRFDQATSSRRTVNSPRMIFRFAPDA